ncbi:hypothetical protein INT45_002367 [Circinella minor]|uniref:Uncharacterized protein n=1 Tax=Circinella minor TaxID=1195481 RepID=A0A8H7RVP3_9FUNG|nr:hypothetical protein INT45_002367 [Circinella minor]
MSKLILLKPEVTNFIIEKFVGPHAVDKYKNISTEWPNLMKSDVVYEPFSYSDRNLPPVLIEIQHTVDLKFYQPVIQYCLQMIKRYPVLPIVAIIGINNTTRDILEMVGKEDLEVPFAASLPCTSWANCFYLINGGTIRTCLDSSPVEPTVALPHFFLSNKNYHYNRVLDAFGTTCSQFYQELIKARQTLTEDEPSGSSSSSSATSPTTSLPLSFTNFDSLPVVQRKTFKWLFVDLWKKNTLAME